MDRRVDWTLVFTIIGAVAQIISVILMIIFFFQPPRNVVAALVAATVVITALVWSGHLAFVRKRRVGIALFALLIGLLSGLIGYYAPGIWPTAPAPTTSLAAVSYAINDGPTRILDMRNFDSAGIAVSPGDKLIMLEVWYRADHAGAPQHLINIEGYLKRGDDTDWSSGFQTGPMRILEGRHPINNFSGHEWTVTEDVTEVSVRLIQNGEVADYLDFPVSSVGGSDLVHLDEVVPPSVTPAPDNLVEYFGFETSATGWEDMNVWDTYWNYVRTIEDVAMCCSDEIERGAFYELRLDQGGWLHYTMQYPEPVKANVVVGHFYLPDTPDIDDRWIGIRAVDPTNGDWLAESADSIPLGEWTQIVLDLRDKYDANDVRLSERAVSIYALYAVEGSAALESDTILVGLDDVAWYRGVGSEWVGDQRGPGRTLFDFEDESIGRWQVVSTRVETDTIWLSGWPVFRGNWALSLETHLEGGGDNTGVNTTWLGPPPQGGWIAQVYLADDVPPDAFVWANLFTYSESGWQDSIPIVLTKGMWNTLVWDTHDVDWGTQDEITIGIQIGAEGGSYHGAIYIDDVQIFDR